MMKGFDGFDLDDHAELVTRAPGELCLQGDDIFGLAYE